MRFVFNKLSLLFCGLCISVFGLSSIANAEFPDKPITIVVPWPAGMSPDVGVRILAERMKPAVGVPVIVTNVVGGSGAKGMMHVRKKPADGYTLINNWVAGHTVAPLFNPDIGYDANKDFIPIAGITAIPFVLLVSADHPANNLAEFVDWAKKENTKRTLKYAACAALSVPRMVMTEFVRQIDLKATAVPFQGCSADNAKSILNGSTDFAQSTPIWIKRLGKKVKPLGIFTDQRLSIFPDLPTFKEQGFGIGWGGVAKGWGGLAVRAGTPADRVAKLRELFGKWLNDEEVKKRSASNGFPINPTSAKEFGELWISSKELLRPSVERLLKNK